MKNSLLALVIFPIFSFAQPKKSHPAEQSYFPPPGQWQHRSPAALGPIIDREDPTGIIIYKGYIVAEWGQPSRILEALPERTGGSLSKGQTLNN